MSIRFMTQIAVMYFVVAIIMDFFFQNKVDLRKKNEFEQAFRIDLQKEGENFRKEQLERAKQINRNKELQQKRNQKNQKIVSERGLKQKEFTQKKLNKLEKNKVVQQQIKPYFQISYISGVVKMKQPWSTRWKKLKIGQIVPINTLLYIGKNSSAEVDHFVFIGEEYEIRETKVGFSNGNIVRLNYELLRQYEVSPELNAPLGIEQKNDRGFQLDLADAWIPNKMVFYPNKMDRKILENIGSVAANKDVLYSQRLGRIKLVEPDDGLSLSISSFPFFLPLKWSDKSQKINKYTVKLWKLNKKYQFIKSFQAYGKKFNLPVHEEGVYKFQIMSSSETFMSRLFDFAVSKGQSVALNNLTADKQVANRVQLIEPADRFVKVLGSQGNTIDFKWNFQRAGKAKYIIEIYEFNGLFTIRQEVQNSAYSINLPMGSYYWLVSAYDGLDNQIGLSATQFVQVSQKVDLKSLFKMKYRGVFEISDIY